MPDAKDFPFDFEFINKTKQADDPLYDMAYEKIMELRKGHTDLVGASISMHELSDDETPHAYKAQVTLYVSPNNVAASATKSTAMDALQEALDEAIRQVRKERDKFRNH